MATKAKKKTSKPVKSSASTRKKSVSECSPRECIRENRELKLHITIITILSVVVCLLVAVLVLVIIKD